MSDYFIPSQKDNNPVQNENKKSIFTSDSMLTTAEEFQQQKQQKLANRQRYGVTVPDQIYEVFNQMCARCSTPEEANELSYKLGSACRYMEMAGDSWDNFQNYFDDVDNFNAAQFPNLQDQKSRFEALSDSLTLGNNNVKLGELGQKLMKAQRENDAELTKSLMAEIDAINQQNVLMQDNAPRSWVMQALEAGAQSLPFTGAVAGAGILGHFIAPAVGTGASFAASSYLSAGTEYIDMLANGASPETARAVAMVSGGIQGIIEADLGITKGIVKGAARIAGKEVAESTAKKGLEEIGRKVFKRFHFGAGKKVLINYLENRGKDILGEGTEEFLQEITSIVGQEVAASLDGYDIPDDDFKHIVKQTTEAFRGGVLGALSMGFIPAGLNAAADVKSFKAIKDGAEVIESEEVFKEAVKDNPVFEGMSDQQKTETIHDVWERAQNRKEEAVNLEAQKIAEGRDAAEGAEEAPEENEEGITEPTPVARNEAGRLYTSDDVSTDDAGNVTGGTFVIGDKTKSENNRYGYITYSTAENGDITIDTFKMTEGREGLRGEAFDEFAREHPDVKIDWNAIGSETQGFKNELIDANPSGSKNGLSYYSSDDLDNIAARKQVADEVRKNIHNVKRNADGSFTRTELSNKQVAAAVTLIESAARRMNMGLNDYVRKTFGNQIFGSREEFEQATLAQGENVNTKAGGMTQGVAQANWREVGQQVKAVIYAGENADFSTWAHEMAHVFQAQLDGDLKTEAETAFNVVGGDWTRSTYTFSDGRTMSSAEAFAYGFQDWLETGKAESEQMKNIFQKFAEFIADAYNKLRQHLNFTPEIESVFNKLLDGDDTIMSKALKAAQEQEGEYRAMLKSDAEAKEAQKQAEAEEAKRQAEAEREEASEGTDFSNEEAEQSTEEIEKKLDEVTNEKEPEGNAIDDALEDLPLTDDEKAQIADVLKDESSTVVEKAEAATEAASSVYDEDVIPDDMFFQEVAGAGTAINKDNYFKYTFIDWKISKAPDREPDYKSESGSEYWYTDKGVYRRADHWGTVATCTWLLDGKSYQRVLRERNNGVDKILSNTEGQPISDIGKKYGEEEHLRSRYKPNVSVWNYKLTGYADFSDIKKYDDMPFSDRVIKDIFETVKNAERQALFDNRKFSDKEKDELIQYAIADYKAGAGAESPKTEADNQFIKELSLESYNLYDKEKPFIAFQYGRFNSAPILFQIAGEIGAENLDNSEVQEGVSRMQNLAIAKQMDAEGKDAKAIRLATGWEKGADGKWRWEIDDSMVHFDLYSAMEEWDNEHPRYKELLNKLFESELSEEEQEEFDKWVDERNYIQDKHTDLSFAEKLYGKDFRLPEVMNHPELFKAYPELKEITVSIKEQTGTAKGDANYEDKHINLYRAKEDMRGFEEWEKEAGSVLLHEVQHIIQGIEGFAKGTNPELFTPGMDPTPLTKALASYSGYTKEELEGFTAEKEIAKFKDAGMTDEEIAEISPDVEGMGTIEQIIERDIKYYGIDWVYDAIQSAQKVVDNAGKIIVNGKTFMTDIEAYRSAAGEVESRNVQARMNFTPEERLNTLLAATEDVAPKDKIILFQTVYHGSGADFDKFDTENFGLSGEGSMSFGYGTYVTDDEEIARDYAERQRPYKKETLLYKGRKPETDTEKFISGLIEQANGVYETVEELKKYLEGLIKNEENAEKIDPDYVSSILNTYKSAYELLSSKDFDIKDVTWENEPKTRLYTVEIPDDGYLDFNKKVGKRIVKKIAEELEKRGYKYPLGVPDYLNNAPFTDKILYGISHDVGNIGTNSGTYADLYELIGDILAPSENRNTENKKASAFLHSIGYVGIKYPAGTIHGNGNGAYNYVIFNDDDAKIVDKLLFQTQAELMDEARQFATWQEFMSYCEESNDEGNVFENDEAWYKSFWEQANGIAQEEEKKAEAEEHQQQAEADTPEMVDRLFISYIKNNPDVVDNFVQQVSDIMEMDLGGDEWAQVDEEGGRERERYAVLQDYISAELSDGNWQTAIAKVQGGHEISDYIRKRLITEMTDSYKARDFRNLYAAVMKENRFTVDALDTRADELLRKLEKYPKRYYDIVAPTEDVTVTTPQRRKEIAQEMQNRDMAARIKAGSLKVDDEVINYLKSVEKKEKDLKKQEQQLTDKIQGLYNDVGNTGLQMLINTHEKLMEQKARLNNRNADTQRKIEKGLRMTDRYTRQTQNMTQTYHELERKFSDLKDSMVITSEVQQILDAQEQRREIREEVARISKERYLADETKKIRVNLVKQLFRKVPLDKVDFKQAQLIIAIQKLTLPNMIGGVNRWIGRNSPFLNAVLSRIVTDSEYKERIVNYLEHVEKQTDTFRDFVESIRNAKSREDFENWGVAEREYAIKYLPKENWVWELKLKEKARELQESLHLDITQEKVERQVYDADGHPVEDDEGKPVMETAYQFKIGDEALNKLLQETLGDELFNRLMNSPMVEWSTQEMEELVARVNQIRDEGITMRAAKIEARKREAQKFIQQVADAIKDTGIVINPDDTPEEKEKKLNEINKILGKNKNLKGTEAGKDSGFKASLNRILHGYKDANVLRVARILDNQSEGVNTYLLYRKEDNCYNAKMRSIMKRGEVVHKVMAANKITEGDLAKSVKVSELGTEFTNDELLFFLAADKDFKLDENGKNDNYAATSRNAVCFGNMMSDTASQELKEGWDKLDKEMNEAIEKDTLTPEQRQLLADNQLDTRPGTTAYINECNRRWDIVIKKANELLNEKPGYKALLEAIQADYADQYERMNEVSINEFNVGVNRVKCYVPLVRREQNGAPNENQVMEDLLAINGVGKGGVNKGMTQSRQTISPLHQRPVQTGLFRTWCDSVERTEHFIAYAPYVRLLNRVYKSNDAQYLRRTIEGRYGKGMLEYIDAYINEVANPNAQNTRSSGAELLHILRGKTAPAYLGWKASAIIKQGLTSPWPYMQFVNPAEYIKAAFKCNNPKMWEAIQEKSVFMKNRRMDPMNDLVDEMAKNAKNKADKFWSNFTKKGMEGLEWIDWACVAPGWYACYEKKYNQLQKASEARYNEKMAELEERNRSGNGEVLNPTQMETIAKQELLEDIEMEAVTYADDCTRQCQPSNRLTDLAPMFKDKNEFKRAFLQFQTSLNVIWQNIRYDLPYAVKQKEFKRIAGTVIGYVMAGIFMNSVMDGIGGDDDDDDTQALRNLIYYSTTQFTDAIPIMGSEITNAMDKIITGKRAYSQSGTDMTPSATKLLNALQKATSGDYKKAASLTAEGIGLFMGAPVSGVKEINKLLGKPLDNGDVDLLRGLSDVYGIAGDILEE